MTEFDKVQVYLYHCATVENAKNGSTYIVPTLVRYISETNTMIPMELVVVPHAVSYVKLMLWYSTGADLDHVLAVSVNVPKRRITVLDPDASAGYCRDTFRAFATSVQRFVACVLPSAGKFSFTLAHTRIQRPDQCPFWALWALQVPESEWRRTYTTQAHRKALRCMVDDLEAEYTARFTFTAYTMPAWAAVRDRADWHEAVVTSPWATFHVTHNSR
jgi:hypothetical protein